MGRIGFSCDDAGVKHIEEISRMPGIEIEGMFTHYAKADELDKTAAKDSWTNSDGSTDSLRISTYIFLSDIYRIAQVSWRWIILTLIW